MPSAIRYGIPFETFDRLNPKYMEMYQKDYIDKLKQRADDINTLAWRVGGYIVNSIQTALAPKKCKYPKEPHTSKSKEPQQEPPEIQAIRFQEWAEHFNKNFKGDMDSV